MGAALRPSLPKALWVAPAGPKALLDSRSEGAIKLGWGCGLEREQGLGVEAVAAAA